MFLRLIGSVSSRKYSHPLFRRLLRSHRAELRLCALRYSWCGLRMTPSAITFTIADLQLSIQVDSRIFNQKAGYVTLLHGDNGAGKTTFIERIMIPKAEASGQQILFLGSDRELATLAIRSWLAIRGAPKAAPDGRHGIANVLREPLTAIEFESLGLTMSSIGTVIMDEFSDELELVMQRIPPTWFKTHGG